MNRILGLVMAVVVIVTFFGCSTTRAPGSENRATDPSAPVRVRLVTSAGDIEVELDPVRAPVGVANFLKYARSGAYDGTVFHRTVPGFVIQGGGYTKDLVELKGAPAIVNEWENGLKNVRGTIAWARDEQPDTATREFYINLADNAKLDTPRAITGNAGYAVFGRVVVGMEVVDTIAAGALYEIPERDMKHVPMKPVVVERVEVE
jgi:cyclophilin family peptidyl-prolyl cis-trans isomerase